MTQINPFNQDFCISLEYHLTKTFANADTTYIHGLWCDGIAMPDVDSQLTKENIKTNRCIVTKAWIGYDGQDLYEMAIRFGAKSIDNYIKDLSLIDCLPSSESTNWIVIDIGSKIIELSLL